VTRDSLPTLEGYLERALGDSPAPRGIRLRQTGQMWLKPGARPKRFSAVQEYVVEHVAFRWRARFAIAGVFPLRVVDRYSRRAGGSLQARLFGAIPLTHESGPSVAAGQALRYLAELPWVPHALLANDELELRELDDSAVEAATQVGGARVAVRLGLDGDRVTEASAIRPRLEDNGRPTPWSGAFESYREVGGLSIPTKAEVRWDLPDGPFTYWSGEITGLEQIP
jgi:Family of unknown function (DUF6544)